jgi:hypothetical protein
MMRVTKHLAEVCKYTLPASIVRYLGEMHDLPLLHRCASCVTWPERIVIVRCAANRQTLPVTCGLAMAPGFAGHVCLRASARGERIADRLKRAAAE